MTFEQCHVRITTIRIQQATRHPLIRVECGGVVYFGRLVRADCDLTGPRNSASPYGILVLESLGLDRAPETILQIANIPDGAIQTLEDPVRVAS